jgi:DNA-binding IclR family transcriptional regulator
MCVKIVDIEEGIKSAVQTLQTVERALAFLEIVATAEQPMKLAAVARSLGVREPTGYHLRNTLESAGYLIVHPDGTMRLGPKTSLLFGGYMAHFAPQRDLRSAVEQLAQSTRETAYLASLGPEGVVVQTIVESTQTVRVSGLRVGTSGREHRRASGKSVLAFLPQDQKERMLHTIMTEEESADTQLLADLEREFGEIHQRGWAIDVEQFEQSVCCIAAPFFTADGHVAGSRAVSTPSSRVEKGRADLIRRTQAAAREASTLLGYPQGVDLPLSPSTPETLSS